MNKLVFGILYVLLLIASGSVLFIEQWHYVFIIVMWCIIFLRIIELVFEARAPKLDIDKLPTDLPPSPPVIEQPIPPPVEIDTPPEPEPKLTPAPSPQKFTSPKKVDYACKHCKKSFTTENRLRRHIGMSHLDKISI